MKRAGARRHLATSPFPDPALAPVVVFERDDRVTHERYGLGTVVDVEAGAVLVDFRSSMRRITTPCVKLLRL